MKIFSVAIILLSGISYTHARNLAITSDGVAIATAANVEQELITYDANNSNPTEFTHNFSGLPSDVAGFDDVTVDPDSLARSSEESTFVFAISADSGTLCSFELAVTNANRRNSLHDLNFIGCASRRVSSSPYVGISAMGGTILVSGGTGGASAFSYNTDTGVLSDTPAVRNQDFGDIGHPDVTLVSPRLAALSTDTREGFGIVMANVNLNRGTMNRRHYFPVENTIGFRYVIGPANFPCVSAVYNGSDGDYLYVANGPITVQDPRRRRQPTVVQAVPNGFEALTVAVNSQRMVAVFGGVANQGSTSAYIVLDISNPLAPEFMTMETISDNSRRGVNRVTSVATSGDHILYVREGTAGIGHDFLGQEGESRAVASI